MFEYFFVVSRFCKFGLAECNPADIEAATRCRFGGAANCSLWFYTRKNGGADIRGGVIIDAVKSDSLQSAERFFTARLEAGYYDKKINKFKNNFINNSASVEIPSMT